MLHHGIVQVFICASNIPSSKDSRFPLLPWETHRPKLSYYRCVGGISICTWRVEFKAVESLLWVLLDSHIEATLKKIYLPLLGCSPRSFPLLSVQFTLTLDVTWTPAQPTTWKFHVVVFCKSMISSQKRNTTYSTNGIPKDFHHFTSTYIEYVDANF